MSCQSRFDALYWMLGAGALGRPRGMVWGGRREYGGGFMMGNTCIPVADSFRYLAKPIQYCKVKKKKKSSCKFFHKVLQKNPNELFGQPSIYVIQSLKQ